MLNFELNLLSPEKKHKLQNIVKFIFSKHTLEIIIFVCAVVAIGMLWSWLVLQEGFAELASASATVNKEYTSYNRDIKNINTLLKSMETSSAEFQAITPKIIALANNLPADIRLTSFYIDRQKQTLTLQGVAKTREDLIAYQKRLSELDWIGEVDTPNSKLFQKENINFEFKTKLKNIVAVR